MLIMPSHDGWEVVIITDKKGRNGRNIEKEILCTTNKEKADAKVKELKVQGYKTKIYQCIF